MSNQTQDHNGLSVKSTFYALACAAFISGANLRLFDALLPNVAEDFGVAPTAAAIVITAFTLAYGLFQIVHGPLGDRLGKLRVIAAAALVASATSLGSAFAPTLEALTWLRFATGIGAAAIVPLSLAWIGDNSSYQTRQATLGRFIGFLILGQVLGPTFGGAFAQLVSWREVFYLLSAVFLVVSVVLFNEYRKSHSKAVPATRQSILRSYALILGDRWVRMVILTVFLEGALFFGVFAYTGAFLKERFALSYLAIGAVLGCYGIGGLIYSLLVRWLLARMSEKRFVAFGAVVLLVCFGALPLLSAWQMTIPVFVVIGFGFYMFHNTLQTKATEMVPHARGMAIAVFAFSLFIGQAGGVAVCSLAIRALGYRWTFTAAGILLMILGGWFAARVGAQKRTAKNPP